MSKTKKKSLKGSPVSFVGRLPHQGKPPRATPARAAAVPVQSVPEGLIRGWKCVTPASGGAEQPRPVDAAVGPRLVNLQGVVDGPAWQDRGPVCLSLLAEPEAGVLVHVSFTVGGVTLRTGNRVLGIPVIEIAKLALKH